MNYKSLPMQNAGEGAGDAAWSGVCRRHGCAVLVHHPGWYIKKHKPLTPSV
jgi:hypothetical protein